MRFGRRKSVSALLLPQQLVLVPYYSHLNLVPYTKYHSALRGLLEAQKLSKQYFALLLLTKKGLFGLAVVRTECKGLKG